MLASWTKILPYFVVKYIAKRNCERVTINGAVYRVLYSDTLIKE